MTWLVAAAVLGTPTADPLLEAFVGAPARPACTICRVSHGRVGALVEAAWLESGFARADDPQAAPTPPVAPDDAKAQARHAEDIKNDIEIGRKYSEQVDKELKATQDQAMLARVQRLGAEMASIANQTPLEPLWGDRRFSKFEYVFKVVQGKDVNAFSLPGGFIYVNEGLIKYAESDDELAGVLAHEIAHASFRHVATLQREQSRMSTIQLPLVLAAIFSGGRGQAGDLMVLGNLVGMAATSGWSVKAELAADNGGFQYMRRSKYDPSGLLTFMERLARDERTRSTIDWGIYRTHPPGRERAQALTELMREASLPIRRSRVTTSFRADVRPGDEGTVEVIFNNRTIVALAGSDALDRADKIGDLLNDFFDSEPDLFEVSVGAPGRVFGRRAELIAIAPEDAAAAKLSVDEYTQAVIRNLRGAIYNLAYRVWDSN